MHSARSRRLILFVGNAGFSFRHVIRLIGLHVRSTCFAFATSIPHPAGVLLPKHHQRLLGVGIISDAEADLGLLFPDLMDRQPPFPVYVFASFSRCDTLAGFLQFLATSNQVVIGFLQAG